MLRALLLILLVGAAACGGGGDDAEPIPGLPLPADDSAEADGPLLPLPPGVSLEDVGPAAPPPAEPDPLEAVDAAHLVGFGENSLRVFVLSVDDSYDDPSFQGIVVTCRPEGIRATVAHGLFPADPGRRLRTSVTLEPELDGEFFGPARQVPPTPGVPHETLLADQDDVARLVRTAFVPGAVVSNGHTAFRNAVPPDAVTAALGEVLACDAFRS